MTLTRTDSGYVPRTNPIFYVPVQQGNVRNLGVSITPGNKAILWWTDIDADELRCAVVSSIQGCFANDVVEPGDVRTAWVSAGRNLHAGSMAVIGGSLYAFVSHWRYESGVENNGKVECYVANDVENPTSWSLHATIQNHNASSTGSVTAFESLTMGPPTILTSGRWVLPANTWRTYAGSALTDGAGLFTSDDAGASWDKRIDFRNTPLGGGNSGTITTCVSRDPVTGNLCYARSPTSGLNPAVYTSANDGTSWGETTVSSGKGVPHFFVDDTNTLYSVNNIGSVRRIYQIPTPTSSASWVDTGKVGITSDAYGENDGFQALPIGGGMVIFTAKDRLTGKTGGWSIKNVSIG